MSDFRMKNSRESTVEDTVVAWAESNGWVVRLMSYRGRRGCPDNFFFGFGTILPIEFKKVGGSLSRNQAREHDRLKKVGVHVPTFDNADQAITYLKAHMGLG